MLTLLIETCTERAIAAVFENECLLKHTDLPFGYNNSKFLLPALEALLSDTGISMADLSLIAAGIGPGSYTGIRVGAITAKSLAYALKIPLAGICSLEGFVPQKNGKFAAMIDAKIGGAYLLSGQKSEAGIIYFSEPKVCPIDRIGEELHGIEIIVTPDSRNIRPKIMEAIPNMPLEWEESGPNPSHLIRSAMKKWNDGTLSHDGQLELLYLRKTQAEIEKEAL